ncbi:hypothetical protein EDB85DRAFT_1891174 [Lactarius pseudohatsudake]|nr:hypothetical protein EDB85DRAFT_1891174 [Lactarius pseudohatsudake]
MEWEKNSAYFYYSYIPNRVTALSYGLEESLKLQVTWQARVPVGSLTTGDYGYIPGGSTDFANFMRLGNILNDFEDGKAMEVVGETRGTMLVWTGGLGVFPPPLPQRQPANPFILPTRWSAGPSRCRRGETWCCLRIMRQDWLTRSLCIDNHQIDDWKPSPLPVPSIGRATGFGAPAFSQHGGFGGAPAFPHHGFGAQAPPMPSIVYPGDVVITRTTTVPAIATSSISDNHSRSPNRLYEPACAYRRRCPREVVDIADLSTLAQICAIPSIIDVTNAAANMPQQDYVPTRATSNDGEAVRQYQGDTVTTVGHAATTLVEMVAGQCGDNGSTGNGDGR